MKAPIKVILSIFFVFISTFAFTSASNEGFTRIFYFRDTEAGRQSLYDHYKYIDILAPQIYALNENGELENDLEHGEVLSFAASHHMKVMPLLTNKSFGSASLAILDNKSMQDMAELALIEEAKKMGYIGYELDFEQMDASLKDKYTSFVTNMHSALNKEGLTLSVAVVAKISDTPSDYKKTLWQDLIGAYDYSALAKASDFISVMSYDDPDSNGPIARKSWLDKVLSYSVAHIPKEKISLGIGLYYWAWRPLTEKLISIGGYEGMKNVLDKYHPIYSYSKVEHAPYLTYFKGSKKYIMWYENGKSISEKIALAKKYGLKGISLWALGLEAPSIFNVL